MTEQPGIPGPHEMRASNADRERFAKILHDAMADGRLTLNELDERLGQVYAARTFGELEPVTRDLPGHQVVVSAAGAPPVLGGSNRIGGRGTSTNAIAILSGAERKGVWTIPPTFSAVAVLGGVQIDLSHATFESRETTIQAFALMGGVEIFVPEGVTVHVTGSAFMGGFENKVRTAGSPDGPVVRINGFAMLGGVEVKPVRKKKKKSAKEIAE
ncbi:MAG: DUF1707 domain-containing protein [Actinomycetota bacterium]|nr:DUF1707 domain-containing protein [Actinomycetota bacterium]